MVIFPGFHNPTVVSTYHASGSGTALSPAYSHFMLAKVPRGRRTTVFKSVSGILTILRTGARLVFRDTLSGTAFSKAKALNNILKAAYDALESVPRKHIQDDMQVFDSIHGTLH